MPWPATASALGGLAAARWSAKRRWAKNVLLAREAARPIAQSLAFGKYRPSCCAGPSNREQPAGCGPLDELDTGCAKHQRCAQTLLVQPQNPAPRHRGGLAGNPAEVPAQTGPAHPPGGAGPGSAPRLPMQVQVLHVLQEALSNVRKHQPGPRM